MRINNTSQQADKKHITTGEQKTHYNRRTKNALQQANKKQITTGG